MEPATAFWHLLNLFAVPVGLGLVAPALAKLVWRQALRRARWASLALPCIAACSVVTVAGLVVTGRDGTMATYGAMVAVTALLLWWRSLNRAA